MLWDLFNQLYMLINFDLSVKYFAFVIYKKQYKNIPYIFNEFKVCLKSWWKNYIHCKFDLTKNLITVMQNWLSQNLGVTRIDKNRIDKKYARVKKNYTKFYNKFAFNIKHWSI